MKNQNSLISLAYIKVNDNPLHVFCQYILFLLLKEPNKELRADLLKEKLLAEFGLNMPQQLINNCIRLLEKDGDVSRLPHGAGYQVGNTDFSVDNFEKCRQQLHEHEDKVLVSLVDFIKTTYKKKWTKDEAREYLSNFLDKEGYGTQLFLQKKLEIDGGRASTSWFIGRYVEHIQQEDSLEKSYLEEIVNGIMILQGIRQTGDYQQNKDQKFKGTVFYFDTKLVLRALGFSWKAQVDSVREMVHLLRERYNAKIGIFPQTFTEVENALRSAGLALQKNKPIQDFELKIYSELYPQEAALMLDFSENISSLLKRELDIDEATEIDINTETSRKYWIETEKIAEYIEQKCGWRRAAIDFDVKSINQINILRKGNYTQQYGGKNKLPVFVTSNSKLVYTFRDYIMESEENGKGWSSHSLPIISDNMLLYRIWLPFATEFSNMPSLTLARFAYSAQSEGVVFFEKFREMASNLEKTKNVDLVNTTEVIRRRLEDILIKATDGDLEQMSIDIVATSFDECVRLENIQLVEANQILSEDSEKRKSQVVELLSKKYINKLGWRRAILFGSKYWWVVGFGVLYTLTSILNGNVYVQSIAGLPVLIELVLLIIDKCVDDMELRFWLYKKTHQFVKKSFVAKIRAGIAREGYHMYTDEVITYCLQHTKVFRISE